MENERKGIGREIEKAQPRKKNPAFFAQMHNLAGAKWGIGTIKRLKKGFRTNMKPGTSTTLWLKYEDSAYSQRLYGARKLCFHIHE
jgi:hypothetical protein